mgnify:CR=1 FL=1
MLRSMTRLMLGLFIYGLALAMVAICAAPAAATAAAATKLAGGGSVASAFVMPREVLITASAMPKGFAED